MKVIFLDIDGVLNSTGSCLGRTGRRWEALNGTEDQICEWSEQLLVLNGGEFGYGQLQTFQTIDPTAVELINRLLEKASACIVLSSTHRMFFADHVTKIAYGSPQHLQALRLYLKLLGLEGDRLIGITPRLHTRRGLEVREHIETCGLEFEAHVAIDDGGDFEKDDCVHHLVDAKLGFTAGDYFACAKILGVDESVIIT